MGRRAARDSCPRWCVADHGAEDEFGEVRHRSAIRSVPAVSRDRAGPKAIDLLLEVHSSERDATVWLYLGDGEDQRLEVTLDSAGRVAAALAAAVSSAAG